MELLELKVLIAVAEEGSATRAARTLAMTQPGVSKHIANLEHRLGGKVFDRKGKGLSLNQFGQDALKMAREIVQGMEDLTNLKHQGAKPRGSLKLGLTEAATFVITPELLIKFRDRFPGVNITLDVEGSTAVEDGVLSGSYNLGVVTASIKPHPLLAYDVLFDEHLDVFVSNNHELARRKRISLEELSKHTLIISPRKRRTRQIIDEAFHSNGLRITDAIGVYIHTAAVRLADAGLGVAILPRNIILRAMSLFNCAHIKIVGDPVRRTICMIRKKGADLPEAAQFFHDNVLASRSHEI